ncbi:MAG: hypothetical protein K2F63_03375, partial [Muribaculaceae bacterium]|nr:hypothetical protein [Muribaculaceae bacterium]
ASWTEVVDLLRTDGHQEEADAVEAVINRYPGSPDRQSVQMRRLPFYRSMLATDYLPRLRRVEYTIVTSRYRPLNAEEIAELYRTDYKDLSEYHFWKLYKDTPDSTAREQIIRRALETHPKFIVAASDLTAMEIARDEADENHLRPFFSDWSKLKKMPMEARYNLAVASMAGNHYSYADSLLYGMSDEERFKKAKMYCAALNGRYTSVLQEIADESPFNEVLLLLALKDDARAWEKAKQLGDSAEEEYVKAIAANRIANADVANAYLFVEAGTYLANAIHKKPELLDIARIDGDVCDLLDDNGNLPDDDIIAEE